MIVLGLESSCDETAAAVVKDGQTVLSSIVLSQHQTHRQFGGVVPELASRNHLGNILDVIDASLREASITLDEIDGIAVTYGPGLIGSLLVGVCTAKALAFARNLPLIGIHHIEGHLNATTVEHPAATYPMIGLVVSGGHTSLYFMERKNSYRLIGHTKDDAAGEAFDKAAKILELGFPGGPALDKKSRTGNHRAIKFPRSQMPNYDFSFSGLKTSLSIHVQKHGKINVEDISASFQEAIVDMLLTKTLKAADQYQVKAIMVCGGVARNSRLRHRFAEETAKLSLDLFVPSVDLCTDNAVMIAVAGYEKLSAGERDTWALAPKPYLPIPGSLSCPP